MTIYLVTAFPYPHGGGLMSHISYLARGLNEDGHRCVIISSSDLPVWLRHLLIDGSRAVFNRIRAELGIVIAGEMMALLIAAVTLLRCIGLRPDIINAQSVYCSRFLKLVARIFGARFVLTVHGYAVFEPVSQRHIAPGGLAARYFAGLEKSIIRKADEVIAVDSRIRNFISEIAPQRVVWLRKNFIDPDEYRFDASRSAVLDWLKLPNELRERRIVLCPRRLVPKNGVENAVMAMTDPDLKTMRPLLVIVGSGQELDRLRDLVSSNHLQSEVWFAGRVVHEQMPRFFAIARCVVVPSISIDGVEEATSIAVLEAMASGVPVIGSAVGGIRELIFDRVTGLLVPPGQPGSLAAAIKVILADETVAASVAGNASRMIRKDHHYKSAARFFVGVYENRA